jgi:hypothetical protein
MCLSLQANSGSYTRNTKGIFTGSGRFDQQITGQKSKETFGLREGSALDINMHPFFRITSFPISVIIQVAQKSLPIRVYWLASVLMRVETF